MDKWRWYVKHRVGLKKGWKHKESYNCCSASKQFPTLGVCGFPKITMSIRHSRWYRWLNFWSLAESLQQWSQVRTSRYGHRSQLSTHRQRKSLHLGDSVLLFEVSRIGAHEWHDSRHSGQAYRWAVALPIWTTHGALQRPGQAVWVSTASRSHWLVWHQEDADNSLPS